MSSGLIAQIQSLPDTQNSSHCISSCSEEKQQIIQSQGLTCVDNSNQCISSFSEVKQQFNSENGLNEAAEVEESSECTRVSAQLCCSISDFDGETVPFNENEGLKMEESSVGQENLQNPQSSFLEEYNNSLEYAKHIFTVEPGIGIPGNTENHESYIDVAIPRNMFSQINPPDVAISSFLDESQHSAGDLSDKPKYSHVSDSNYGNEKLSHLSSRNLNDQISLENSDSIVSQKNGRQMAEGDTCNTHCYTTLPEISSADLAESSLVINLDACTDSSTICNANQQNTEKSNMPDSTSQPHHPICSSDVCNPPFIYSVNEKLMFENNLGDSMSQLHDSEIPTCDYDEFFNLHSSMIHFSVDGNDDLVDNHLQTMDNTEKQVLVSNEINMLCSEVPNDPARSHVNSEENTNACRDYNSEALCYEPPRFPSIDVPFVSCDLVSSVDLQQAYSPLGIRQLMMSSINCTSPYSLWDSLSCESSPDAVLKNAAKSFLCTPSILKKRQRELLSPLCEKSDRKSGKKINHDLFCAVSNRNDSSSKDATYNDGRLCDILYESNKGNFSPDCQKSKSIHSMDQRECFDSSLKQSQDQPIDDKSKSAKVCGDNIIPKDSKLNNPGTLNDVNIDAKTETVGFNYSLLLF